MKGFPSKASRMASNTFLAFFRAVEIYPRIRPNRWAPSRVRKHPDTFCWTFTMRISRSAWLLSNGIRKSYMKASTWGLKARRRINKLSGWVRFGPPLFSGDPADCVGGGSRVSANPVVWRSWYSCSEGRPVRHAGVDQRAARRHAGRG